MEMLRTYSERDSSSSDSDVDAPSKIPHPAAKISVIDLDAATFDKYHNTFNQAHKSSSPPRKRPRAASVDTIKSKQTSLKQSSTPSTERIEEQKEKEAEEEKAEEAVKKPFIPHSTFHLPSATDYQNRPWTQPAPSARTFAQLETYTAYCPKRTTHTLQAHANGVTVVRFAPLYGQFLVTAGGDGCTKVWKEGKLARTYAGHEKMVRAIDMDCEGRLLSAGFDKSIRLWDVESGRISGSFRTGLPRCVQFTPRNRNEFLVGCADGKVLQMDTRDARKVVQEYDQHMGGVNAIAFIEDNRRFVTSAEDRVLRVWEYGIPVVVKYVSEAGMQALPVVELHPNRKWLAAQSLDNKVVVYAARNRFKLNVNKTFSGHVTAGHACGLAFSPDGRFLASGDGSGRLFVWDWKSGHVLRTLQGHRGVCSSVAWHPTQPSLVASGGWDGVVKLWN